MPFERLRKILGKERILSWNHDKHPGIVWRFPDPSSDDEKERDPNKIDAFQVKIGERAIALINNEFYEDTPPGTYWLKGEQKKGLEIIFVDQGQFKEPWGIPGNILTKDNQQIGAHGYHVFRVADPKNFVLSIVSAQRAYASEKVNEFIRGHISNLLRQHLSNYTVLDGQILREHEAFVTAMKAKCQEMFSRWGLELVNLEVEIYVPEDIMEAIKEKAKTEIETSLVREMELRIPLEQKKLTLEHSLDMLKLEIEKAKELKELEKQKELEAQRSEIEVIKKQVEKTLKGMDVDLEKLRAEAERVRTEIDAGRMERLGQAEALVTEMKKRAEMATDLLAKATEVDLRIKEAEAKAKAELELEKVRGEKEIKIAEAKAFAEVGVAEGKAMAEVAEAERQIRALREMAEIATRIAEATAIGGVEGEAIRKGLEEKFLTLLSQAGIDVAKWEQAKSMAKVPPKSFTKIEKEVTLEAERTKKCPSCGRMLAKDAKYCDNCGKPQ